MTKRSNIEIKNVRSTLRFMYGYVCNAKDCEETKGLEFAHLKPTTLSRRGRGRKERIYDILKNPQAYRLLCHSHHTQLDETGEVALKW